MIKIGVCDNEREQVDFVSQIVTQHFTRNGIACEVVKALEGQTFLKNAKMFDLVFLDVSMGQKDQYGVQIGKGIRKVNKTAFIIYYSSCAQYMASAQATHYFYYLLKPYTESQLIALLEEFMEYFTAQREQYAIANIHKTKKSDLPDIYFLMYMNDGALLRTSSEKVQLNEKEVKNLDIDKYSNLVRTHSLYLVNLEKIKRVKEDSVWLINGEQVPLAAEYAQEVKNKFHEWLFSQA